MKKLLALFLIFLYLPMLSIPVLASTDLDTEWLDGPDGNEQGSSIEVEQGEDAYYFIWISVSSNTIGYTVRLDNGSGFEDIVPHTVVEGNWYLYEELSIDTTSWEPGTYDLLVSANDDGVDGAYDTSAPLELTITESTPQNDPPNAPTNPNPSNGADDISLNPTLSWTGSDPDGDDLTYDVYFGTSPNPTNLVANDITTTSYQATGLNYETQYYWKIVASDDEYDTSSSVWSFTTLEETSQNHWPNAPTNLDPENGATNISLNPLLSWYADDPDNDILTFTVYFGTDSVLDDDDIVADGITEMEWQITDLDYNTMYYWGIIARDPEGLYSSSTTLNFTTLEETVVNNPPNAPTNPNPSNGADDISLNPTLSWTGSDPDGDDLTYDVYFGTSPNPTNLVANDISINYYQATGLNYETQYYWKIVASDDEYDTSSSVWSFTTIEEDEPENHPPEIDHIDNQRARCGRLFSLQVTAQDLDDDELTYLDNTELFEINSETGLIEFTPSCNDRGTHQITITVADEHGSTDTQTFTLEIYRVSTSGSGGGNDDDDEEEELETEIIVKEGICINDNDGDDFGFRTILYKTVDLLTREVYSVETSQEVCSLEVIQPEETQTYEFQGINSIAVLVALIFLAITIPLAVYLFTRI